MEVINVGNGNGLSVFEMVSEFEKQSGEVVKYQFVPSRPGAAAEVWADVSEAKQTLGFEAKFGVTEMCRDTWLWQSLNPNGYQENRC